MKKWVLLIAALLFGGWHIIGQLESFGGSDQVNNRPPSLVDNNVGDKLLMKQPALVLKTTPPPWTPSPPMNIIPKLRPYLGIEGRKPAVPTYIVTNKSSSSTIRYFDSSPFRFVFFLIIFNLKKKKKKK
jgi:hypothetical protein